MNEVCPLIKEWKTDQLSADRNRNGGILKEIHDIHFPCLKSLYLGKNDIQSIECMSRIDMPSLSTLSLSTVLTNAG